MLLKVDSQDSSIQCLGIFPKDLKAETQIGYDFNLNTLLFMLLQLPQFFPFYPPPPKLKYILADQYS